ncbi:hypothetical protein K227x_31560 [Rubripirellula lacrimiformis]|uniref:Uncharacterized protein n=1 Tax=Rubripirellula lacrimiformis TaxID=1930273 RepID=A0A517NCA8_9BACT|nr:hypothetical protein K227x_31560 [Rubripirellula lacrimiformis]
MFITKHGTLGINPIRIVDSRTGARDRISQTLQTLFFVHYATEPKTSSRSCAHSIHGKDNQPLRARVSNCESSLAETATLVLSWWARTQCETHAVFGRRINAALIDKPLAIQLIKVATRSLD